MRAALRELGVDLDQLRKLEPDAALGNGGLGRLAACFMESMATLGIAGLRLRHPLRPRPVPAGASRTAGSTNMPEDWLSFGNPWEFERPEVALRDRLRRHGRGDRRRATARARYVWHPAETVDGRRLRHAGRRLARPHVNTLRLWSARATDPLRLDAFNRGDHVGALADRVRAEAISRCSIPSDDDAGGAGAAAAAGVLLRLRLAAGPRAPAPAQLRRPPHRCPTRPRSSSTTRIRRSPSPS